ncbi:MAG: phosphogluconate dehydratase [Enterobacterales bacterium]|nr:phosphogluconate dehydratase [Enterobacterales bacterium]
MSLNDTIIKVTQRIVEKSQSTRSDYLTRMSHAAATNDNSPTRSRLSCGNLAHGMAACNPTDKSILAAEKAPNLAIVNAYNDMLSAHQPYVNYPDIIKQAAAHLGATAQVAGGVPAMCDGVTQGQEGMELSLFSRDLIAMATAVSLSHDMFDGVILLGICDKIVPGLLIGALSFGHLPCIFLPAGPMPTGQSNDAKAKVRQDYAEGKIGRKELLASESASYHTAGTCTFYGTANSNQMLMEIMGLQLPGSSFVPPTTELRQALSQYGVRKQLQNIEQKFSLASILSEKTIVNGLVGLLATGGSTNHTIHLIAIARAAGIIIDWQDMSELSKIVPLICRVYPNGSADINHFQAAGGMPFLMQQLSDAGFLHQDVKTIMGTGLSAYFKEPKLVKNPQADIYRQNGQEKQSEHLIQWKNAVTKSLDESVLSPVNQCFSSHGGLNLLTGNLGRSVIKTSAVAEQYLKIEAPAVVFDDQNELVTAFKRGQLNQDFVAVIRFQGPKANGMPELHKLTPILASLQAAGHQVALVTDGRMSGASGKVPAAIHLIPEALEGGPIAQIQNGDLIELDAANGILTVKVNEIEFKQRPLAVKETLSEQSGMGRELFKSFRNNVTNAEHGAMTFG